MRHRLLMKVDGLLIVPEWLRDLGQQNQALNWHALSLSSRERLEFMKMLSYKKIQRLFF